MQVEDLADPIAKNTDGIIVRAGNANTVDDQRARVARKFQWMQTDTPWIRLDDVANSALRTFDGTPLIEPGERYVLDSKFAPVDAMGDGTLDAFVVSGHGTGIGCARMTGAAGKFEVCRTKVAGERLLFTIEACTDTCMKEEVTEKVTDRVGIVVKGSCYRARSAPELIGTERCFPSALATRGFAATGTAMFVRPTWNGASVKF
jgi:hypothetical protein